MKVGKEAFRLKPNTCLSCGKLLNAATYVGKEGVPQAGAVTVCFYCGHLMIFADDLSFRNPTSEELYELAGDQRLLAIQAARGKFFKK